MDSSKNEQFLKQMTTLNQCFVRFATTQLSEYPGADLTPTINSYLKHVAELDKKFSEPASEAPKSLGSTAKPTVDAAKPIVDLTKSTDDAPKSIGDTPKSIGDAAKFTTTQSSFTIPPATSTTVGASRKRTMPPSSEIRKFDDKKSLIQLNAVSEGKKNAEALKVNGIESKAAALNGSQVENDENEEPPKVEAVQQTEEGALFSMKTAIFTYKESKWEKVGVGYVNILSGDPNNRLLVRAANTLGTILINTYIAEHFKSFLKGEKAMTIRFPDTDKTGKTTIVQYLFKGGEPEEFKTLAEHLNANIVTV